MLTLAGKKPLEYLQRTAGNYVMVDNIAVTPEVVTALGRVAAKWHVQSSDVDDRLDEFPSLDEALIRAATRAFERRIRASGSMRTVYRS